MPGGEPAHDGSVFHSHRRDPGTHTPGPRSSEPELHRRNTGGTGSSPYLVDRTIVIRIDHQGVTGVSGEKTG